MPRISFIRVCHCSVLKVWTGTHAAWLCPLGEGINELMGFWSKIMLCDYDKHKQVRAGGGDKNMRQWTTELVLGTHAVGVQRDMGAHRAPMSNK